MKEIKTAKDLHQEFSTYVFLPFEGVSNYFPGVDYQCNCGRLHPVAKETKIAWIKGGRTKFILMCDAGYISYVIPPIMPFITKANVEWSCKRELLMEVIKLVGLHEKHANLFNLQALTRPIASR